MMRLLLGSAVLLAVLGGRGQAENPPPPPPTPWRGAVLPSQWQRGIPPSAAIAVPQPITRDVKVEPVSLKDAIALSQSKNYRYSHLAKVVLAGLQEYQFQQETGGSTLNREDVLDTVRRSIQRATALTASDLKKGVSTLATIGSTAPFVGLLGTVVGVINAFVGIASTGSGGIGAVSAGIAEALIETALGLFVAIPAVWFYNFLTSRIEYFNVEMDNSSSELVDYFIKKTA